MKRQFQAFSYKVENKADDTLDVHIDGIIVDAETQQILKDWFGDDTSVSYRSFRNQVTEAKPKVLNVFINSGGGMVTDAMAIRDFLAAQEAAGVTVNRVGRGLIASAATFILMGKNSKMSANSWFMIHNVSGGAYGDVNMVESYAKTMRKFNDSAVDVYSKASGLSATVIGNMMNVETWMPASEAKDKGFVSALEGDATFTNKISPEAWPFENKVILNTYNAAVKDPKDAGSEHTTFFTRLNNDLMKFIDQLKTSITGAKADKKFENLAGKDDILALVESVLTPFATKIDEHINAEKPATAAPAATTATPAATAAPAATTAPVVIPAAAANPAAAATTAAPAATTENQDPRVMKLEKELEDLRKGIANSKTKPESDKTDKDILSKYKVSYEED